MKIQEKLDELIKNVVDELISGEYVLVEINEYTSRFKKEEEEEIEVWTCNGEDGCKIYGSPNGLNFPPFKTIEIKKEIYKIATTPTMLVLTLRLEKATKNKDESLIKYKTQQEEVEKIHAEIKKLSPTITN